MFRKIWDLLAPFHRTFALLVLILILYEGGNVLVSYTISLIVRLFDLKVQLIVWALAALFLAGFNEAYMRLDNAGDWHIIARQSHPIYKFLKMGALKKFLAMDVTWHQHHNSGTLVGQVSDGVWKTMDIVDLLSWEFVPTMIQTILSLVPLLIITPGVAGLATVAFGLFVWLTLKSEKSKRPLRAARQTTYEMDASQFVQAIQGHETVVMFGQQARIITALEKIQDKIIDFAFREHRLGVFVYNRWRIRILTSIRLVIYAVWVSQLYAGTLDVANLIFVSVLTEKLFNSFWRFARLADHVYSNSEAVMRLVNLMNESEPVDSGTQAIITPGPLGISMDKVCFAYSGTYSEDDGALHDFSLRSATWEQCRSGWPLRCRQDHHQEGHHQVDRLPEWLC